VSKSVVYQTSSKKLANAVVKDIRRTFKGEGCAPEITGRYNYSVSVAPKCEKRVINHFIELLARV
jgi:hypothetical protein